MAIDYLYKNWPKIGGVSALFLFLMLFVNSKADIGSLQWLFWLNLPLYLVHQVEEYVYPGGFIETLNEVLTKQRSHEFPLNEKDSFYVNVVGIWVLMPVMILLGTLTIWLPLIMVGATTFNAFLHIGVSIRFRAYRPGLVASLVLNLPLGIAVFSIAGLSMLVTGTDLLIIILLGIVAHWLILLPVFAKFLRNRKNYA